MKVKETTVVYRVNNERWIVPMGQDPMRRMSLMAGIVGKITNAPPYGLTFTDDEFKELQVIMMDVNFLMIK